MSGQGTGGVDPAMLEEDLTTPDPVDADTQTTEPASPVIVTDGNEEPTSVTTSAPEKPDESKIQAALREYGKLTQTQTELAEAKKKLEELKTIEQNYRNIESNALKSPESMKLALTKLSGWSDDDADRKIEELRNSGVWQQTPVPTTNIQPQINPTQIIEQAKAEAVKAYKAEVQNQALQRAFFEQIPELDPVNVSEDKRTGTITLLSAVEYEAKRRLGIPQGGQLSPSQVSELVTVYKEFTGKTDEQLQQAKAEGKIEGIREMATQKAVATKSTKGTTPKESNFGLSADELKQAQDEGLTPEEFANFKNPVSQVG